MYKVVKMINDFTYDKMNIDTKNSIKIRFHSKDSNKVNKVFIVDKGIIRKMVLSRMSKKIDDIIEQFSMFFDLDEDNEDAERLILDQIARFEVELMNKYLLFLKEEEIKTYRAKLDFLEKETKKKSYEIYSNINTRRAIK